MAERSLPPSLLRIRLTADAENGEIVLQPSPADLLAGVETIMNGVVEVAGTGRKRVRKFETSHGRSQQGSAPKLPFHSLQRQFRRLEPRRC